tara:strand:- start:8078 stop:9337 length:1260 start_codon:yes stop_codon:yes gene_type:complete
MSNKSSVNLYKTVGPGILFASTAIGVSHLVQSTKAGALFGFGLMWAVIIANLLKYPFFEFGSRYANATGKSIIDGYLKLGKWALWSYFLITIGSMFFVCAAVGKVTTGFMQNLFHLDKLGFDNLSSTLLVFSLCTVILVVGKFKTLDKIIKIIGVVLLTSTMLAFIICLFKGPVHSKNILINSLKMSPEAIAFLIPLMGWMPTAVDLSTWNSLWTVEKIKTSGYHPKLKETLIDFNVGYIISALLSICFITLGAFLMFGGNLPISKQSDLFANDIVNLYTKVFGSWSYLLIGACTFSIMFGTCIAVFDGYGRSLKRITELIINQPFNNQKLYPFSIYILTIGTFLIIWNFENTSDFGILVNIATILSFIVAPVIAIFNFILVKSHVNKKFQPPLWLNILAYIGIIYLTSFSIYFIFINL